jgi:hypothetical protein
LLILLFHCYENAGPTIDEKELNMDKKSAKTADPAEVKKQLEAIAGQKIDISDDQIAIIRWPVGAHNYEDGTVLWRSIIFPGQNCIASSLLDGSGVSTTGTNGEVTFLLSNFICLPLVRSLSEPVNVLATARTASPFFVTTTHTMVPDPNSPQSFNDVQITVYAWDANGKPAPGVSFDWRCRVVSNPIIL